jgi:transposase
MGSAFPFLMSLTVLSLLARDPPPAPGLWVVGLLAHDALQLRASLKGAVTYPDRWKSSRSSYDSDLTGAEWEQLVPLVPAVKLGDRPPRHSRREVLNGLFYAVRSGTAWKLLPHDPPPWRTVYHYFWLRRRTGAWQRIQGTLTLYTKVIVHKSRFMHRGAGLYKSTRVKPAAWIRIPHTVPPPPPVFQGKTTRADFSAPATLCYPCC